MRKRKPLKPGVINSTDENTLFIQSADFQNSDRPGNPQSEFNEKKSQFLQTLSARGFDKNITFPVVQLISLFKAIVW